ncbi:protein MCM10 homolog [Babylonia areolata]|uniref:protein MCM10 homolog n=1 Tax=Babylonia areolata TaxID=304850 RepID=UPI003FD31B1C
MAGSDDDCDLDTLSALLDEDSEDCPSAHHVSQQPSPAAAATENSPAVKDNPCPFGNGGIDSNTAEEEEMDMEALSSMLDQDSDLEEVKGQPDQDQVTAEDIAAFFDESSDSEPEGEQCNNKDSSQETAPGFNPSSEPQPVNSSTVAAGPESPRHEKSSGTGSGNNKNNTDTRQEDAQHVKQLQDELAIMQQRMMEIQQLLASQKSTATSATTTTSATVASVTRQTKRPGMASALSPSVSSSSSSSPASFKVSSGGNKKAKRPTSSSPNVSGCPEKKVSSKSSVITGTERKKTSPLAPSGKEKNKTSSPSPSSRVAATSGGVSVGRHGSSSKSKPLLSVARRSEGVLQHDSSSKMVNGIKKEQADGEKGKQSSTFLADMAEKEGGEPREGRRTSLKRSLFGDADSDSDWEDMDGEKAQLNSSGKEIKRLLQGQRQQQACTPSYTSSPSLSTTTATWKSKASGSSARDTRPSVSNVPTPSTSASGSSAVKKEPDTKDFMTEKFSGLRIVNPKVSSIMLASKMEGRRMIPVSRLHLKVKTPDLQGDWVTIGVIVQKSEARKSQTGKTYSIWKLSDLQETDVTVSFFLFGQVYKQLWKMDVGNVIGLLNPNIMDSMEKSSGDVAFTVNNAQQVMEIGRSKDLGWCIGKTKRGTTCTNFINKKQGDFCTYHVQAAYRQQSAKRSELHGSCPGTTPKSSSSLKSKILQNNTFFYGGECYTAGRGKGGGKKDKVTLGKLQAVMTQQEHRKVNTLAVQNLMPEHSTRVQSSLAASHQQPFLDMLSVPTAGSMNLVRHIAKAERKAPDVSGANKGEVMAFQSVHAGDLLKQHREETAERIRNRQQQLNKSQQQPNTCKPPSKSPGSLSQSKSPRLSGSSLTSADRGLTIQSKGKVTEGSNSAATSQPKSKTVAKTPVLGKGFYPGGNIDLFAESSASPRRKPSSTDVAKRKAIQKVQAIGGLGKSDPNAVRPATQDPEKIRKRVLENIENEHKKTEEGGSGDDRPSQSVAAEPPRKRSRLLGNVDPNSEEVKQLLKARSSHTGALAQAEAEREERYFDNLEQKEKMEEKMKSVTSMEVTVVTCEQCKYTAMSQSDRCKQERHTVRRHKGKRRFFACRKCKHRTVSLDRYPTTPCTKCGEHSYEKTSMHREKTGPKLESETLCLRGDESKFINSMDQKVFMATLPQD